jgi:chloramphenicol 3-O phosphotransferase
VFYAGLYESIAAHSRVGLNVAAGLGQYEGTILADCARRLDALPAMLVGVR